MLIVNTEEVFNKYGDLVKLIYHYKDGSMGEKDLFISAKELVRIHKQLEDNSEIPPV